MNIIISNSSNKPIYEQITDCIKELILDGTLHSGELLPSIRALAKDLKISVITTKKAYEELEKEDYIEIVQSKGCFVKSKSKELRNEEILKNIENNLLKAKDLAGKYHITKDTVKEMLDNLYMEV